MLISIFMAVACGLGLAVALLRVRRKLRRALELIHRLDEQKRNTVALLHDLGEGFSDSMDSKDLLGVVLRCTERMTGARGAGAFMLDPEERCVRALAIHGILPPLVGVPASMEAALSAHLDQLHQLVLDTSLPVCSGIIARVIESGGLVLSPSDPQTDLPLFSERVLQWKSFLGVPLIYRQKLHGLLVFANKRQGEEFQKQDLELLRSVAVLAAFSLHNIHVYQQLAEKDRLDRDIRVAREIQQVLLPSGPPQVEGFEIEAINTPAREVSGDYYDFFELEHGLGIVIADVSGKGVPASLVMTMCRAILRAKAPTSPSPSQVLREVNALLFPDMHEGMFITMTYCILDPERKTVKLARAGHECPLICYRGERAEILQAPGMALGIDNGENFDTLLADVSVPLSEGDSLVLYTDGVTETPDPGGNEFGRDNFIHAVCSSASRGAAAIVGHVVERIDHFRQGTPRHDDVTMIAIYARRS